ncbi:hypothetical protein ACQP1K_01615 [Sphaerimonospora sp. CA-214678]
MVKSLLEHLATLFGVDDDPHMGDDSHALNRDDELENGWEGVDDVDDGT